MAKPGTPQVFSDYLEKDAFEQLLDQGRLTTRLSGPLQALSIWEPAHPPPNGMPAT
jgi:hypothetical protein